MSRSETDDFIAALDHPTAAALSRLCSAVREGAPAADESIKWNAPSFSLGDHFATTGLERAGGLRLVLHTGAKKRADPSRIVIDDPDGLLEWKGVDRALIVFRDEAEVEARADAVAAIVDQWVTQLPEAAG